MANDDDSRSNLDSLFRETPSISHFTVSLIQRDRHRRWRTSSSIVGFLRRFSHDATSVNIARSLWSGLPNPSNRLNVPNSSWLETVAAFFTLYSWQAARVGQSGHGSLSVGVGYTRVRSRPGTIRTWSSELRCTSFTACATTPEDFNFRKRQVAYTRDQRRNF
jgi:hypothetical protein